MEVVKAEVEATVARRTAAVNFIFVVVVVFVGVRFCFSMLGNYEIMVERRKNAIYLFGIDSIDRNDVWDLSVSFPPRWLRYNVRKAKAGVLCVFFAPRANSSHQSTWSCRHVFCVIREVTMIRIVG